MTYLINIQGQFSSFQTQHLKSMRPMLLKSATNPSVKLKPFGNTEGGLKRNYNRRQGLMDIKSCHCSELSADAQSTYSCGPRGDAAWLTHPESPHSGHAAPGAGGGWLFLRRGRREVPGAGAAPARAASGLAAVARLKRGRRRAIRQVVSPRGRVISPGERSGRRKSEVPGTSRRRKPNCWGSAQRAVPAGAGEKGAARHGAGGRH